jgi:alpha-glucosidase (family GH31 glycosyl hydrolase)
VARCRQAWTGAILIGGRTVEIAAPLDRIPILVRAGGILPMIYGGTDTLAGDLPSGSYKKLDNALQWRVFASRDPSHRAFVNYHGTTASRPESGNHD